MDQLQGRDRSRPPGWRENPSSWPQRLPIVAVAVAGFAPAMDEVLAGLQHLRRVRLAGGSSWRAFLGLDVHQPGQRLAAIGPPSGEQ